MATVTILDVELTENQYIKLLTFANKDPKWWNNLPVSNKRAILYAVKRNRPLDSKLKMMNDPDRMIYRARGIRHDTGREGWVTTVWRSLMEDAIFDANNSKSFYDSIWVVSMKYDDFLKREQKLPKVE